MKITKSLGRQLCIAIMATSLIYPFLVLGQSSNLPKQAQLDLIELRVYEHLKNKNLEQALAEIAKYREIEVLPPTLAFLEAKIAWAKGDSERTVAALEEYFNVLGDGSADENYNEALRMYEEALSERESARSSCLTNPTPQCVFAEALDVAQTIENVSNAYVAYTKIAYAQARAGYDQQARQTYDLAIKTASTAQAESEDEDDARARTRALRYIAESLAKAGYDLEAKEAFELAIQATSNFKAVSEYDYVDARRTHVLREIAELQAQAGYDQEANDTFALSIAVYPREAWPITWVAQSQLQAGYEQEAKQTFTDAIKVARNLDPGTTAPAENLRDIAIVQAEAGYNDEAKQTLALALESALKITNGDSMVTELTHIASSYAKQGHLHVAESVLNLATDIAQNLGDSRKLAKLSTPPAVTESIRGAGIGAPKVSFANLIFADSDFGIKFDRCSGTTRAAKILVEYGPFESTDQALNIAFKVCRRIDSESDLSIQWLKKAQASHLARSGKFSKAIRIARSIKRTHNDVSELENFDEAMVFIAKAQIEAGDAGAANEILTEISPSADVAKLQLKASNYITAQQTLTSYLSTIMKEEYSYYDFEDVVGTYALLAKKQAEVGGHQEALQILAVIIDAIDSLITLHADSIDADYFYRLWINKIVQIQEYIVKDQADKGNYQAARQSLATAIEAIRDNVKYPLANIISTQLMISKAQGDFEGAKHNLASAMELLLNYKGDPDYQETSLSDVIWAQLNIAKIQTDASYSPVSQVLADSFATVHGIDDASIRAPLLAKLASYLQTGTWELSELIQS